MSKLGCITGVHRSVEYPVAASQKFNRTGGAFVHLDGSGHVTLSLTATATIFGYAVVPQGIGSGLGTDAYWQSSATAGADRIPVITDLNAEFLVPSEGAVTVGMAGNACDIVGVNDGTSKQTVNEAAGTTDVLIIQGRGMDRAGSATTSFAIVKINPAKKQAD